MGRRKQREEREIRAVVTVRAPAPHAARIRACWLSALEKMVARTLGVGHGDIRVILTAAPRGAAVGRYRG